MTAIHQSPMSRRVMNLAYLATRSARRFPQRPALVWRDRSWTWSELDARVSALAAGLAGLGLGVGPGDAVLVHSKNSNEMLEAMLATFRLGAVFVPTNFRLLPDDVVYMAKVSKARLFLCQSDFPEHARALAAAGLAIVWLSGEAPPQDSSPTADALIRARLGARIANAPVETDTACWLFFTSGTTGKPKAAVLTHGQMSFVVTNHLCDLMPGTTEEDGELVVAPLSHGAGIHALNVVARGGMTVLMPTERLDPAVAFALIERHRLTNMFTVPTILKMLVEHPAADQHDHSSLRHVIYAGAPMYRQDQVNALARLGAVLVQYYGLGEVTGNITVLPPRAHDTLDVAGRIGTCGIERIGMQVSVQDDAGRELGAGETGEICVIGPAVFAGYYDNPEANAKAFRNGWFRTGDVGHIDHEGFVYLTGRASDMYISGGSNIYPREIEEKLLIHDAITEAAVVGIPDPKWGEVGIAVCVRRPGSDVSEEEVMAHMASHVARYKLPRQVVFWDALPKSGYGKVPKQMVKDELRRRGIID